MSMKNSLEKYILTNVRESLSPKLKTQGIVRKPSFETQVSQMELGNRVYEILFYLVSSYILHFLESFK